jgi:hypothetical protein
MDFGTLLDTIPKHCFLRQLLIRPREIHFLRFILEAYEGLATVTTLQSQLGLVQVSIAPGCEDDVERILEGEQDRLQCRFTIASEIGQNPPESFT